MQALLLATGETQKLKPLTERVPSPMVPIMNRPVMVYNLELLGRMGFKRILVSVHSLASVIEKYFGDGQRWGVSLEYILQRDALGSAGALRRAKQLITDHFIVMPADQIADLDLFQAIDQHLSRGAIATAVVHAGSRRDTNSERPGSFSDSDTGIYIFAPRVLDCIPARQPFEIRQHLLPALLNREIRPQICPIHGYWNPLDTFQDYMEAQQVFLSRAMEDGNGSEQSVSYQYNSVESRLLSPGIWSGKNVRIHQAAKLVPPVYIGSNSWVGRDVELGPGAVIGSDVMIDQGATISSSIILNNTYVGKLVHLENRLAKQDLLIDLDTNEHVQGTDPVMLGETNPGFAMSGLQRLLDVCLAFLFLAITLPFLLILGILLLAATGRIFTHITCKSPRPSRRYGLARQAEAFGLLNFNTRKADGQPSRFGAWLERWEGQRLPELWNVLKGDLALVGLKPIVTEEEERIRESWQLEEGRAGFTGQWYLHCDEHSPLEDSLAADAYYLAICSTLQDWKILSRTPAAWLSKVRSRAENSRS